MKNHNKKSFLYLIIALIMIIVFYKGITSDTENGFLLLLVLISPIIAIILLILSIINAVKWKKEKKKSVKNSNFKTTKAINYNNISQQSQTQSNNAVSHALQHTETEKPAQKKKPIEFHSFDLDEDSYKVYKIYSKVKIVGTQYVQIPSDIVYGESVTVKNEKENEFDPNAIALYVSRNNEKIKIGYLSKGSTLYEMANDFINRGNLVNGKIDNDNNLTVSLCYYKHKYNENCYESITKKKKPLKVLTYNVPEDEAMFYEGCEVSLMLEFGEIYAGLSNFKVSEATAERLLESDEPLIGYVTNCDELYDGKQKIQISIFEKIEN